MHNQQLREAASTCHELPEEELPGAARSRHELPGVARSGKELLGVARSCEELLGADTDESMLADPPIKLLTALN